MRLYVEAPLNLRDYTFGTVRVCAVGIKRVLGWRCESVTDIDDMPGVLGVELSSSGMPDSIPCVVNRYDRWCGDRSIVLSACGDTTKTFSVERWHMVGALRPLCSLVPGDVFYCRFWDVTP